jgi:hypothetical protein
MIPKKLISYILLFSLFIILTTQTINAELTDIQIYQEQISQGEVFQAEIFLENPLSDPKKQDIELYSSKEIQFHMAPFLTKLSEGHYFLYFELPFPLENDNYTLKIKNIPFIINDVLQEITVQKNFTVINTSPSVSITPGFYLLDPQKTQIYLIVESKDIQTNISFQTPEFISHPYLTEQLINPNNKRKFIFDYDLKNQQSNSEIIINYGNKTFNIPLLIEQQSKNEPLEDPIKFIIDGTSIDKQIESTQTLEGYLLMQNKINKTLTNLEIKLTGDLPYIVSLNLANFAEILPFSNFSTMMAINKDKAPKQDSYSGQIILKNNEYSSSLDIQIKILKIQETPAQLPEPPIIVNQTTPQQQDQNTSQNEIYEIIPWDIELSEDTPEETTKSVKSFAFFVIVLIVIAIIVFLLSSKKKTKKREFSDVMQQAQK